MRVSLNITEALCCITLLGCTSPHKNLADVDAELKADRARRNYVLETDAQAQTQGLSRLSGKWETKTGTKKETKTLRYRRGGQWTQDSSEILVLVDAVYARDEGLKLVFNRPIKLRCCQPFGALDLFVLRLNGGICEAAQCFEHDDGMKPVEVSCNYAVLGVRKKDTCPHDISQFDVEPRREAFGLAVAPTAVGAVPLWEASDPADKCVGTGG